MGKCLGPIGVLQISMRPMHWATKIETPSFLIQCLFSHHWPWISYSIPKFKDFKGFPSQHYSNLNLIRENLLRVIILLFNIVILKDSLHLWVSFTQRIQNIDGWEMLWGGCWSELPCQRCFSSQLWAVVFNVP